MADTALKFEEIKTLILSMEHPSCSVRDELRSMSKIERIKYWLNFSADRQVSQINRPRLSLYAASHGFAKNDDVQISYYKDMVAGLLSGEHAVNEVINLANADLRLYDLNMDEPTKNIRDGSAMDEDSLLNSLAYGLMTIEPENDLVSIVGIGAGSESLGKAFCASFVDQLKSNLNIKLENISLNNCFDLLMSNSGYELNAIIGSILAARLAHIPVILEGYTAIAAGLFLNALNGDVKWHCAIVPPTDENEALIRDFMNSNDWLVLDDPRPYGLQQPSVVNGGMHIAALKQMLILDGFYGAADMSLKRAS